MDSHWSKFPEVPTMVAAYLLAGMEPIPGLRGMRKAPALVSTLLHLITQKTGAQAVATMPGQRVTITQSEFQSLLAEYGVKPTPLVQVTEPQAVPLRQADTQPQAVTVEAAPMVNVPETREQRQDRRLKACEDDRLVMPANSMGRLPDGVGGVANKHRVTRQTFSTDVKAALKRREAIAKPGRIVHRT